MRQLSLAALLFVPAMAWAVPMQMNHQGRVFDDLGIPLDGTHDITFALFDADTVGTQLWVETQSLDVVDGYYAATLGSDEANNPLDDQLFDGDLWLELQIDTGLPLDPRLQLVSVPFARRARELSGGVVDASEIRVNGTTIIDSSGQISGAALPGGDGDTLAELGCNTDGQVAQFDGLDWQCVANPPSHEHDATEITSGVLDITRIPIGTSATDASAGDHLHGLSQLTGKISDAQLPVGIEATVEGYISNGAIDLAGGSTVGGVAIADSAHSHPAGDADTLDGVDSTGFATSGHAHAPSDADTLDGVDSTGFATAAHSHSVAFSDLSGAAVIAQLPVGTTATHVAAGNHNHSGVYSAAGHNHSGTYAPTSHTHAVAEVTAKSWTLVHQDAFSNGTSGWTNNTTTNCGQSSAMLGGYNAFAGGTVTKTLTNLPTHSEIKVEFDYNFIDSWDGESGTFDLDGTRRWSYARGGAGSGDPNICGGAWGDGLKFPVEITVAHTASTAQLRPGSTLDQGATDESWGIDNLRVYVR